MNIQEGLKSLSLRLKSAGKPQTIACIVTNHISDNCLIDYLTFHKLRWFHLISWCGNSTFPQNFHIKKLGEISVFYAVSQTVSLQIYWFFYHFWIFSNLVKKNVECFINFFFKEKFFRCFYFGFYHWFSDYFREIRS